MRNQASNDSVHKTFDNLWRDKKNKYAACLLLASLDKMSEGKSEFRDKINQITVARGRVAKENGEFSETTVQVQCTETVYRFLCVPRKTVFFPAAPELKNQKIKLKPSE